MATELAAKGVEESARNKSWRRLTAGGLVIGLASLAGLAGWEAKSYQVNQAGPKYGIDSVYVDPSCGHVTGLGPENIVGHKSMPDQKRVVRNLEVLGYVTITLSTQTRDEKDLRDSGWVDDPSVTYNQLTIDCSKGPLTSEQIGQLARALS